MIEPIGNKWEVYCLVSIAVIARIELRQLILYLMPVIGRIEGAEVQHRPNFEAWIGICYSDSVRRRLGARFINQGVLVAIEHRPNRVPLFEARFSRKAFLRLDSSINKGHRHSGAGDHF